MWYGNWKPYVPVAERRRKAQRKMEALRKKGMSIEPITIEGRAIAKTFWGEAWCDHLESFSDFANRLPRGRTYVRNGSVCHLSLERGKISAHVCGSELYKVEITIGTLPAKKWGEVKRRSTGRIGSLIELLQGNLSDEVMQVVTDRKEGLFPLPGEIKMKCSCPDWAVMCKHVAAVLYGVGSRLDSKPELLFALRGVDHTELISADVEVAVSSATTKGRAKRLKADKLADVFGIDMEGADPAAPVPEATPPKRRGRKPKLATAKTPKATAAAPDAIAMPKKPRGRKAKSPEPAARAVVAAGPIEIPAVATAGRKPARRKDAK